jgi:hypothetical protein
MTLRKAGYKRPKGRLEKVEKTQRQATKGAKAATKGAKAG